jgi:methylthioribose-1-phosphate isomerase
VNIRALCWADRPDGPGIELLDQTRLPDAETFVTCADVPSLVDAIRRLVVRGAPLLGIAGAFGVALAAARGDDVEAATEALAGARPTAVNLGWGARRALAAYQHALSANQDAPLAALCEARSIAEADAQACARMAKLGLALVPAGARILTHCNTGALVTAGDGTAFGLVLAAHRAGMLKTLYVGETRPLLQGSRLTAYEAGRAGMPHVVLADSAAGSLMASGEVDLVVVGADRIAADGSVANKVGTYGLAVLARHHRVPFVVVAPVSTIDFGTADGESIRIEQRSPDEVTHMAGQPVAPADSGAYNPAFDVTPPGLISAIVTEAMVIQPVTAGNLRVLNQGT